MCKKIKDFEEYMICKDGKVYSLKNGKKRLLKPYARNKGRNEYPVVTLHDKESGSKMRPIHRLVAEYFIPNPENKKQVNHIDGDKSNYSFSNLEWVTQEENMSHALEAGLKPCPSTYKEKIRESITRLQGKPVRQLTMDGALVKEYKSLSLAAELSDYSYTSIALVCRGKKKFTLSRGGKKKFTLSRGGKKKFTLSRGGKEKFKWEYL